MEQKRKRKRKRIRISNQKLGLTEKLYIGIDNGVSGSIGWSDGITHGQNKTPVFKEQNYTKAVSNITRIDYHKLYHMLTALTQNRNSFFVVIERPMVNPGRFKATISAIRALECTQVILGQLEIPYQFIDSREWQKLMLPKGIKGAPELKKASLQIGKRLFPDIDCKPDADGILIAEWARRTRL